MSGWFRFYDDFMSSAKVEKLTDKEFRLWVKLLAIASKNGGDIPPINDLKAILKVRLDHLLSGLKALFNAGLIDLKQPLSEPLKSIEDAFNPALEMFFTPHNWNKRQYKSDSSAERVAKHRAKCNVTVTPHGRQTTETDTEKEKNIKKRSNLDDESEVKNSDQHIDDGGWFDQCRSMYPSRKLDSESSGRQAFVEAAENQRMSLKVFGEMLFACINVQHPELTEIDEGHRLKFENYIRRGLWMSVRDRWRGGEDFSSALIQKKASEWGW